MKIFIAADENIDKAYALRVEVFVGEQGVDKEIELDEHDRYALHIVCKDGGDCIGCARLLTEGTSAHIGRLAVKKSYRGKGVGSAIMRYIIDYCKRDGYEYIWLNSQLHATAFYQNLGFVKEGNTFFEAGIEHIKMVLSI